MLGTITIRTEAKSVQHLTALRQKAHDLVDADEDTQVVSSTAHKDTTTYTVVGVQDGERVELQVEAESEMEAEGEAPDGMVVTDVKTT